MKKYIKPETTVMAVEVDELLVSSNRDNRPPGWNNPHNPHYDDDWDPKKPFWEN